MAWKIEQCSIVLLQVLAVIILASASPLLDKGVSSNIRASEINYRLPTNVIPSNYKIILDPLIEEEEDDPTTFTGEVIITVNVTEETESITLHYNDLSINELKVTPVGTDTEIPVRSDHNNVTHFFVITNDAEEESDRIFKVGEHVITIAYEGFHRDDMYGFYRSSYKDEDGNTV
jgi:hypothetical protein